jgi:hypothetical protein
MSTQNNKVKEQNNWQKFIILKNEPKSENSHQKM